MRKTLKEPSLTVDGDLAKQVGRRLLE